ncbi:MAG: response regulator transcription factor [Candidatus Latescibacteria bacterium]|jgi:two-component system alkaline phosphatase synthesis response regulator PhoP|nr:response regulator transcription factor [Candidatus Latescibacterota bacterium]
MSTILLLADETHGARIRSDLEYIGHAVNHVIPGSEPDRLPDLDGAYDLVLFDQEARSPDVAAVSRLLRPDPSTRNAPLLVLSDEASALALDFALGIVDFIIKPYSLRELEARLRLALWNTDRPVDEDLLKVQDLVINFIRYEVRVNGTVIDLTLKEYELLKHLSAHPGRVFTRSDLLDSIWGYDYYGGMRTVDVHIRRLRSKLGDMGKAINTVRGVGYSFSTI